MLAAWLIVLTLGVLAAPRLSPLLSNSLDVPGSESDRAQALLEEQWGERPDGTFTVVFPTRTPQSATLQREVEALLGRAAGAVPDGEARQVRQGGGILYGDVATPLALEDAKGHTDDLRAALAEPGAPRAVVTGAPAIQHDLDPVVDADLRRAELVAIPIALLVLVLVLGVSGAVLIPFAFAACTIAGTVALLLPIAHAAHMATYVENLVVLIGLALAIDYALLCVDRFRTELGRGGSTDDAIVRTMATTGRTVVVSGIAVAIGLSALLLVPVPFVRSIGIGGTLIPLVSVAALLTLQPALLSLLGSRVLVPGLLNRRPRDGRRGPWRRFGDIVVRRRWPAALAGAAVLAVLALPTLALELTPGSISGIPGPSEAVRGARLLTDGVGPGAVTPTQIVVDTGSRRGGVSGPGREAIVRLVESLGRDPEVFVVANGVRPPYVAADGRYARVIVAGRHEYGDAETRSLVRRMRADLVPEARFPEGAVVVTGGTPAQGVDFLDRLYDWFPLVVVAVLAVTGIVLLHAFRSLLLALKAVLLNLLSVAAALGVVVIVVQWGVGADLLGVSEAAGIEGWIPVFVFALLFGLSMDYEVFLVMPMREAVDAGADTGAAVVGGLTRTGPIITAAAAVMIAVFSGFVIGSIPGLQQFGLALAVGVLVDATVVRMLLVPAIIALLGARSWWLPRRLAVLERDPVA